MFRVLVYLVAGYLVLSKHALSVRLVGLGIAIAHLYKDVYGLAEWPAWCEVSGFLMAYVLVTQSLDPVVQLVGVLKGFAHVRQALLKDNEYYSIESALVIAIVFVLLQDRNGCLCFQDRNGCLFFQDRNGCLFFVKKETAV